MFEARRGRRLGATTMALLVLCLVGTEPAAAANFNDYRAVFYGSATLIGVSTVIPMAGNYYEMARRPKGTRGWLISGYVFGAVAAGLGSALMYFGARQTTDAQGKSSRTNQEALYWGTAPLAIGAATLVGTLLNQFLPRNPRLSLSPTMFHIKGQPTYYGVALTWVGW